MKISMIGVSCIFSFVLVTTPAWSANADERQLRVYETVVELQEEQYSPGPISFAYVDLRGTPITRRNVVHGQVLAQDILTGNIMIYRDQHTTGCEIDFRVTSGDGITIEFAYVSCLPGPTYQPLPGEKVKVSIVYSVQD